MSIPFWAKALLFFVKFLPIPMWMKAVIEIIVQAIENLPKEHRQAAKAELIEAVRKANLGDADDLAKLAHKHCSGVGCPSDIVGK